MNIERMKRLRDILAAIAEKPLTPVLVYDVEGDDFYALKAAGAPRLFSLDRWLSQTGCGTVACALGEACLDPQFKEQGLFFSTEHGHPCFVGSHPEDGPCNAAGAFFDIPYMMAVRLFMPHAYPEGEITRPDAVIARIDNFLDAYADRRYGENWPQR